MLKRSLKNLIILMLAPILTILFFYATRDLSWLSASVLDVMEVKKIQENRRGLAYKNNGQTFEVFWSELAKSMDEVHFFVFYNPDKVSFIDDPIGHKKGWHFVQDWVLSFDLKDVSSLSLEKEWFQLPFSWDAKGVILGEARGVKKGEKISFAIGKLNILEEHITLP